MTRLLRAYLWCQVSRLGLWAMRKRIADAGFVISDRDEVTPSVGFSTTREWLNAEAERWYDSARLCMRYREMLAAHADHCEALQHARAGR